MILLRGERFRKFGTEPFNKEFSERNKITEVLLRSVMKKGTLRSSAGAFVYYDRRSRRCAWVRPAG